MADWRQLSTGLDGTVTQLKLDRTSDGKREVTVQQLIPPETCNAIFRANEFAQTESSPVGKTARGHTQRHHTQVARMPQALYYQLMQKLGPPWDPDSKKNWRRWLNDPENRSWRVSLGQI